MLNKWIIFEYIYSFYNFFNSYIEHKFILANTALRCRVNTFYENWIRISFRIYMLMHVTVRKYSVNISAESNVSGVLNH